MMQGADVQVVVMEVVDEATNEMQDKSEIVEKVLDDRGRISVLLVKPAHP